MLLLSFAKLAEMRLLIVSSTEGEIAPLREQLSLSKDVHVLISGVGMMATAYHLGRALALNTYQLVLNLGVCGSFKARLQPGTVVNVHDETLADLGAEDGQGFLSVFDLELEDANLPPFSDGKLVNPFGYHNRELNKLPVVSSLSVNSVSGREGTIERLKSFHDPDIESMEGAAVFYACLMADVPFLEVRAVSNFIEQRNRNAWKLDEAIRNLNDWARAFIDDVGVSSMKQET
jgi:futalosine hydrolase